MATILGLITRISCRYITQAVWSQSFGAIRPRQVLLKTNSGFCIDSLSDLSRLIESCSISEYESKMANVKLVQDNVTKGYYLKKAINEVISHAK